MLDWIKLKYKIWKYHRKFGHYKSLPITQEEYENFIVSPEDREILKEMNKSRVFLQFNMPVPYPFILRTKKK